MLIDSHCHLDCIDLSNHDNSFDCLLEKARENQVSHMLCVSIDLKDLLKIASIAENHSNISLSVGVHPNTEVDTEVSVDELLKLARHPKCVAIGETGLDYYRNEGDLDWQRQRFITHIQTANACDKPLIIHTRQAAEDTIRLMRENEANIAGGVMHCFAESWDIARDALDLGFYISFSGIVTFKNAKQLQEVAKKVPLDRILIETDSPYLAPTPFRGKPNHPALVKHVAEYLAQLLAISYNEVAQITTENFYRCFKAAKSLK